MNNFQKQFMVSQRAIARKYAQNSPDSPSEKTVNQTVWSGLTVFSWPLLSTDIDNRGRLYINLDLEIFVLTFLVLSHHWNISDSNTPKVKPRSRVKYLPEVKVKFCNSGYPVNGDFSTCRAVKDFLCLRVSFLVLNFSSRSVVQISW